MKHGRFNVYCTVQATKNLAGLILAERVGYERLVFLVLYRNAGEFSGCPQTREKCRIAGRLEKVM